MICRACGETFGAYACERGKHEHYPEAHCPECHAELVHGKLGPPPTGRTLGSVNYHESDRQYQGDHGPRSDY